MPGCIDLHISRCSHSLMIPSFLFFLHPHSPPFFGSQLPHLLLLLIWFDLFSPSSVSLVHDGSRFLCGFCLEIKKNFFWNVQHGPIVARPIFWHVWHVQGRRQAQFLSCLLSPFFQKIGTGLIGADKRNWFFSQRQRKKPGMRTGGWKTGHQTQTDSRMKTEGVNLKSDLWQIQKSSRWWIDSPLQKFGKIKPETIVSTEGKC